MQYMLLIYNAEDPDEKPRSAEELRAGMETHRALMEETKQKGIFIGAQPLKPSTTATTVRLSDDGHKPIITDGPYAETKEQLAGYYLLNCKDLDEAIGYATRIRTRCAAGRVGGVEIRPVLEFAEIEQKLESLLAAQHA